MKDLLVVTTFFDYFGSKYMLPNFLKFKAQMDREGVDLAVFEAAVEDQPFRLDSDVHLRSKHLLWQKERMINLAAERYGDLYKNIAWIDNDIICPDGWSQSALEMMKSFPMGQLFSNVCYTFPDGSTDRNIVGYVKGLHDRQFEVMLDCDATGNPGTAWIAKSSLLKGIGIYDGCITCSSDTFLGVTLGGERTGWVLKLKTRPRGFNALLNSNLKRHHLKWHNKFLARLKDLTGSDSNRDWCGFLNHPVKHLYHGKLNSRKYMDGWHVLRDNDYDPETDIAMNVDGLYEWSSNKLAMHEGVKEIFQRNPKNVIYS